MFEIKIKSDFDAAHFLRGYEGKCENLHGHRFSVVVGIKGERLNEIGLAYDFRELKRLLEGVLETLDHTCLNDLPWFQNTNPSSENIAQAIYWEIETKLRGSGVSLSYVEVWESPQSGVRFSP